jgi:hypothetical protein
LKGVVGGDAARRPAGWSIETPYGPAEGHMRPVDDPRANFDRPKGWLLAGGQLGDTA